VAGGRWRQRARGVLPYLVVAGSGFLLAYVAVYLFVFPTALVPTDRPVPDVVGLLVTDAERTLRDAGFAPRVGSDRLNASVPPNTVLRQNPAATSVKPRGTPVVLDIAREQ
jgi:beta-lactam-binding protein with PASTA domain